MAEGRRRNSSGGGVRLEGKGNGEGQWEIGAGTKDEEVTQIEEAMIDGGSKGDALLTPRRSRG